MRKRTTKKLIAGLLSLALLFSSSGIEASAASKVTVKLNKTKATVTKGKKVTLKVTTKNVYKVKSTKWSTSKKKVATVTSKGVVKGVKAGSATISCTVKYLAKKSSKKAKKKVLKCKVTVKKASSSNTTTTTAPTTNVATTPGVTVTAGPTAPVESTNPGGTTPTESDNPGGTTPTESDNPGGTIPTESDNPGGTAPTESDNPGGTTPTESDNPGGTNPTESDNPAGTNPTESTSPTGTNPPEATNPTGTSNPEDTTSTEVPSVSQEPDTTLECVASWSGAYCGEWSEWSDNKTVEANNVSLQQGADWSWGLVINTSAFDYPSYKISVVYEYSDVSNEENYGGSFSINGIEAEQYPDWCGKVGVDLKLDLLATAQDGEISLKIGSYNATLAVKSIIVTGSKESIEPSETEAPEETAKPEETTAPSGTKEPDETTEPSGTEIPEETIAPNTPTSEPDEPEEQQEIVLSPDVQFSVSADNLKSALGDKESLAGCTLHVDIVPDSSDWGGAIQVMAYDWTMMISTGTAGWSSFDSVSDGGNDYDLSEEQSEALLSKGLKVLTSSNTVTAITLTTESQESVVLPLNTDVSISAEDLQSELGGIESLTGCTLHVDTIPANNDDWLGAILVYASDWKTGISTGTSYNEYDSVLPEGNDYILTEAQSEVLLSEGLEVCTDKCIITKITITI